MKLFEVSYGVYVYHKVAKTENEAIEAVQKEQGLSHLPFTAKEIDLEGYKLVKR